MMSKTAVVGRTPGPRPSGRETPGDQEDVLRRLEAALRAAADGDFAQRLPARRKGVMGDVESAYNDLVERNAQLTAELVRLGRVVGREGRMNERARSAGAKGGWETALSSVNGLVDDLVRPTTEVARVIVAVAEGDLTQKMALTIDGQPLKGEFARIGTTVNAMVDQLGSFADEVSRVAREVGTEGKLGGQAKVPGVAGTWKDLTDNVNFMASNLTGQVRNIAQVTTAVANGDLSQKITVDVKGEVSELKQTINVMVDQLRSFADEVTRVAREVGTEGKLGGQAEGRDVSGVWRDLTENANFMASNLTSQVRNIPQGATAGAKGDRSKKITVDARGEVAALAETINSMTDTLSVFAEQVTGVAREVGTEGKLGGQAEVPGVAGTWKDLTDNVNSMAANLTSQVRNIAQVTTAVAEGDLSSKITVDAKGEVNQLKDTINTMVDQLRAFADEVTRVAREVGTDGRLGGQAFVPGVGGTWKDLTDNVNFMAANLTDQVRNIAQVTTAVAKGALSQKIPVEVRGEVLQLKNTINTMVDQLRSFADEVTRVAREVGTEGKLGGQAEVEGVSGTWRGLTENVNQLAGNLTTQVRAIAEVSTAVTQGDLTRSIAVEAQGEVAELKDNINQMIANLKDTTSRNEEQDWLKTNLARISGLMQGQRDLQTVSRMIMSELTPTVSAQHGAFFLGESVDVDETELRLIASYGYKARKSVSNRFKLGESLVGQAALEKAPILITEAPPDYIKVTSGLGDAAPVNIIVLPVLFEEQVLGVIELASLRPFSEINQTFLEQVIETIGVVLNTIIANMRTEELLEESQRLTQELQSQSQELQQQQEELRRSNAELESQAASLKASEELLQQQQEELQQTNEELQEKARLLAEQNASIEVKNREIEMARLGLEEKAQQLALSSKYKSEFLANMSHELRTPLNSLLILAKLLADNQNGNLDEKQVEFARTIHSAGSDLLTLINDILDLSKVEAGKMDVVPGPVGLGGVCANVELSFRPVGDQKGLEFSVTLAEGAPESIVTDEQRLHQILKNLLSNAFKFTDEGAVSLVIGPAPDDIRFASSVLSRASHVVAFSVNDTGIGVPPDKLRLVFEAFQQADGTTSRKYGGTGLGLNISREIARLLGGEIRAESIVDEGSTFTLYLPENFTPVEPIGGGLAPATPEEIRFPVAFPSRKPGEGPAPAPEPEPALVGATTNGDRTAAVEIAEEPTLALPDGLEDDRASLFPGDRVLLVIDDDQEFARMAVDVAHSRGFKGLIALRGEQGLALAHEYKPDALLLSLQLPITDGGLVLEHLKRHPETRHIPVHVTSDADRRQDVLRAGAVGYLEKPVGRETLEAAYEEIATFIERRVKNLLVVEDDDVERTAVVELIGSGDDVEITPVGTGEEAEKALEEKPYDCMVLDLKLPDGSGFALLEKIKKDERHRQMPVIVHTGKDLTRREETRLKKYAEAIVVKDVRSPERLLDETALFLHRIEARLPSEKRKMLEQLHNADAVFEDKKVLIVDDDVRNVFALASVFEGRGMEVLFAENGREGLDALKKNPDVDLVLMDIMMPEMDGYETTRAVRELPEFKSLPIVALTAKAMKGDREKSIASGASDYITKPVDVDQLLSLMRVWLYQ